MQLKQIISRLSEPKNVPVVILASLAFVAFLLACGFNERLTLREWRLPIEYGVDGPASDVKSIFAGVKAASEGHYIPFLSKQNPQLGAPHVAVWDDYPCTEQFHILIAGILARAIGVFAAVNLLAIIAHVSAVLGFCIACRAMKCRWEWSCMGGLLFGFAPYLFARSEHHLTVAYVVHIPLAILVFRWAIAECGLRNGECEGAEDPVIAVPKFAFRWALGIAVFTGLNHVYYTNMLVQFLGLAFLYQAYKRRWLCAFRAAAVAAAAMAAFILININSFWASHALGPNPAAVSRIFQWLEFSAYRFSDMFIAPPSYWMPSLAHWGSRFFDRVMLKGEVPCGSYIGMAGIAAFVWMAWESIRNTTRVPYKRPPWEALLIGWIIIYATVGGLNCWAGSLGMLLFRSTTRYNIFIQALLLMFAVRRLSAISGNWSIRLRAVVACALLIALGDQIPATMNEDQDEIARVVNSDRSFTEKIESRLHPNSMVFQLPIMNFPESPAPGVAPYDHFRPYLFSKTLRYSFGEVKGRPQSAWQDELALLQPEELMKRLETYGFGAVYINLNGFADRAKTYLDAADGRGASVIYSPAGDLACVFLKPAASPALPPTAPYFGKGWNEVESDPSGRQQRICRDSGELVLTNTGSSPVERELAFMLGGFDTRRVRISAGGKLLEEITVKASEGIPFQKKVTLRPGANVITFTSDRPSVPSMRGPVSFLLVNFQVRGEPVAAN